MSMSFHESIMRTSSQEREELARRARAGRLRLNELREGRGTFLDFDEEVARFGRYSRDGFFDAVRQSSLESIRDRERVAQLRDALRDAITTLQSLQKLDLWFFFAEESHYSDAAQYIEAAVQARELVLSLDVIHQRRIRVPLLANALTGHPNLERISLRDLPSTSEVQAFARTFPTIPNLTKVHFATWHGNTLVLSEEMISQILEPPTIRVLSLEACEILSFHPIANETYRLTKLDFERCKLPKEGGSMLAESLYENTALTELRFYDCRPDSTFFSSLRNALRHNQTLTQIEIGCGQSLLTDAPQS